MILRATTGMTPSTGDSRIAAMSGRVRTPTFVVGLATACLLCVSVPAQSQSETRLNLYIQAPPDAQAIKEEIVKKVAAWDGVSIVTLPAQADLVLDVVQSGKLNVVSGSGDKGAAVLKDANSGEDLWSDSRGGGWSMRGFSNRAVGRKLGDKLVEFLHVYVNKGQVHK
jgi:hypothetical protein